MFKQIIKGKDLKTQWEEARQEGYKGLSFDVKADIKKADNGRFYTVASTNAPDRDNEVVVQNFELENYKKNPVVVDSHNYGTIENIVGKFENIEQTNEGLTGEIVFAEENPKGLLAKKLTEGGFLQAVSIGFIPKEISADMETIIKSELLELSVCVVQSNPEALIQNMEVNKEEAKTLKDYFEKEGRTLSEANRKDIKQAVEYLNNVLSRSETGKADKSETKSEENPGETSKSEEKTPACRLENETEEDCRQRKIPELMDEGYNEEQATAMAYDMCAEQCGEENKDEGGNTETEEEDTTQAENKMTAKEALKKATEEMKSEREKKLNLIAKELGETHEENVNVKKRKIFKTLRQLKSQDKEQ